MRVYQGMTFADMVGQMYQDFLSSARPVDVGQWQGLNIKGNASKVTWEIREAVLQLRMPDTMSEAQRFISPNLPWAEDHFLERVGGQPLNPPPSQAWWPFAQNGHEDHLKEGQFSHTYPERFWPRHAGGCHEPHAFTSTGDVQTVDMHGRGDEGVVCWGHRGIRFDYGDLNDVVWRLIRNPMTRQAYLPVWFPEDTGAPEGERVPCTIGYHFMIREGRLHVSYTIRACDFMRHFKDDVYMAIRLGQWVRDQIPAPDGLKLEMGELTMHIGSFHIFKGDWTMVQHRATEYINQRNQRLLEVLR